MHHISIIHSSVGRHLSCFHFLGIVNKTAIDVDKQGSQYSETGFFGYPDMADMNSNNQ